MKTKKPPTFETLARHLNSYKNVSSFQFIDALNTLLGTKNRKNTEKFSLRDKAHIRNLIEKLNSEIKNSKKFLKKTKKEIKENEPKCIALTELINRNSELRNEAIKIKQILQEQEEKISQEEKVHKENQKSVREVRDSFNALKIKRDEKEEKLSAKYKEALKVLEGFRDNLKSEISRLKLHKPSTIIGSDLQEKTEIQSIKLEIGRIRQKMKQMDDETEQLKQKMNEFMKKKELEYIKIRENWENVDLKKRRLLLKRKDQEIEKEKLEKIQDQLQSEIQAKDHILQLREFEVKKIERRIRLGQFGDERNEFWRGRILCTDENSQSPLKGTKSNQSEQNVNFNLKKQIHEKDDNELDKKLQIIVYESKDKFRKLQQIVEKIAELSLGQEEDVLSDRSVCDLREGIDRMIEDVKRESPYL